MEKVIKKVSQKSEKMEMIRKYSVLVISPEDY